MEKIRTIDEFNQLLGNYFSKAFSTNGTRLIRDSQYIIDQGRLYYIKREDYILFYEDRHNFYNLYYFIDREKGRPDSQDLDLDKRIVLDHVYRGEKKDDRILNHMENKGFTFYMSRVYQSLSLKESKVNKAYRFASDKDLLEILKLQDENIDKYTGNRLALKEMEKAIKKNQILAVYCQDRLIGYLRFKLDRKSSNLEGIVVDPNFRSRGYSKDLLEGLISYSRNKNLKTINLWVRTDNTKALKLYKNYGFKNNKYTCDNYIK